MKKLAIAALAAALSIWGASVLAAQAAVPPPATPAATDETALTLGEGAPGRAGASLETSQGTFFAFVQMLLVLAAVIAVIWAFFRIVKSATRGKGGDSDAIRVLATRSLSPSRSLHLVSVGKTMLLLGAGEGGISVLTDVDDQEFKDAMFMEADRALAEPKRDFRAILAEAFGQKPGAGKVGVKTDFLSRQRDRLKKF